MRFRLALITASLLACVVVGGCRSTPMKQVKSDPFRTSTAQPAAVQAAIEPVAYAEGDSPSVVAEAVLVNPADRNQLRDAEAAAANSTDGNAQNPEAVADADDALLPLPNPDQATTTPPEVLATPPVTELTLAEVTESVRNHFPLILQAAAARRIASGQALSASGAFDHKLGGFYESQPLDFYENYRGGIGVKRDTTWGGQTFAGYRIGRGIFEPWYLERETNKGGEFKAGFMAPIVRDRWIDANRSELWQAQLERRRVEPEILAQVIGFVRDGSVTYWSWVAAGANERVAAGLLDLAVERNEALAAQVEAQEKADIDLVDNRRIIVSRESKLIDARRKLQQATVKLSLFYRSINGEPALIDLSLLPDDYFTRVLFVTDADGQELMEDDEFLALAQRPELTELQIIRQQLSVALRQARNETLPDIDGGLLVGQDVGEPTSSKRDKSEFELEALVTISVPLERRKAFGKIRSLRGKLAQVTQKNRFTSDKIVADVRISRAALEAAKERVAWAAENFDLAIQMQEAEQELFDLGQSTLFNLNIREKQAAEAAAGRVEAQLEYHIAKANYAAAMGFDSPE